MLYLPKKNNHDVIPYIEVDYSFSSRLPLHLFDDLWNSFYYQQIDTTDTDSRQYTKQFCYVIYRLDGLKVRLPLEQKRQVDEAIMKVLLEIGGQVQNKVETDGYCYYSEDVFSHYLRSMKDTMKTDIMKVFNEYQEDTPLQVSHFPFLKACVNAETPSCQYALQLIINECMDELIQQNIINKT